MDWQSTFSTSCTIYCTGLSGVTLGYNKMMHSVLMQTSSQWEFSYAFLCSFAGFRRNKRDNLTSTWSWHSLLPCVTVQRIYFPIPNVVQMEHDQMDTLKHYWSMLQQSFFFLIAIYINTMKWDVSSHSEISVLCDIKNWPQKRERLQIIMENERFINWKSQSYVC